MEDLKTVEEKKEVKVEETVRETGTCSCEKCHCHNVDTNVPSKEKTEENEESGLIRFAKEEMKLAGLDSPDSDYGGMLYNAVLDLIKVFTKQGHSGMSANITVSLFKKLALWEPITPITDTPESWNGITQDDTSFQNIRDGRIFKDKDRFGGKPYTVDGRVFSDNGGKSWWTCGKSHKVVNLPCMHPERIEYILTEEQFNNLTSEQMEEMETKNPNQKLFDLRK